MNNIIGGKNIEYNKIKTGDIKEKIIYKENITNEIKNKKIKINYLLFSILFNKYFLISKKHLIDFDIFYNNKFVQPLDNLPEGLLELDLNSCINFNHPINKLPSSLQILSFGWYFDTPIDNLPASLEVLYLGEKFNQSVDFYQRD